MQNCLAQGALAAFVQPSKRIMPNKAADLGHLWMVKQGVRLGRVVGAAGGLCCQAEELQ